MKVDLVEKGPVLISMKSVWFPWSGKMQLLKEREKFGEEREEEKQCKPTHLPLQSLKELPLSCLSHF